MAIAAAWADHDGGSRSLGTAVRAVNMHAWLVFGFGTESIGRSIWPQQDDFRLLLGQRGLRGNRIRCLEGSEWQGD